MGVLENKIDFVVLVSVNKANCNGDPLDGNRPRTDYNGFGEISDVCIKRKIRNRMQDLGNKIFVQSEDRCDDGYKNLDERAKKNLKSELNSKDDEKIAKKACELWMDVRSFGQVFALKKGEEDKKGVSVGVRGPVSIHQAVSLSPVDIESMQITKSVKGVDDSGSDKMGMKHFVRFGLYLVKGSINVQLAQKTGFTQEDADIIKECLRTLFVNDVSSARPDGSMEVYKIFWWQHNCKDGQYSSARVHRSIKISQETEIPSSISDYRIEIEKLEGLEPEIIDGI